MHLKQCIEDKVELSNRILDCSLTPIPKLPNVTLRRPKDIYCFVMYCHTNYALSLFGWNCIARKAGSKPAITILSVVVAISVL